MPLGQADLLPESRRKAYEQAEEQSATDTPNGTVVLYGSSDDLIEVEGEVEGCDEYDSADSHFMLIGDGLQVRVRVWYTQKGVWAIAASQAAEGMKILPVRIEDGEKDYSVKAIVEDVRLVIHEKGKEQ